MGLFTARQGSSYHERLVLFVRESNSIEGIHREPTRDEVEAHHEYLEQRHLTAESLERLVARLEPGAVLRRREGCNVTVGNHYPPPGGPGIPRALMHLLFHPGGPDWAHWRHNQYETLHPFTDGNGRSGRALWLHDMGGPLQVPLGFLHTWYYQSLTSSRAEEPYEWPST